MTKPRLIIRDEVWPIAGSFVISRGAKTAAHVVLAEIHETQADGRTLIGRGECVPYARYDETVEGVKADLAAMTEAVAEGLTPTGLLSAMAAGAARNALDCALLDLAAKRSGRPVWSTLGLAEPQPMVTAETISIGTPAEMEAKAKTLADRPLLKIKVGADDPLGRVAAVRRGAPDSRLIVDANEAWTPRDLTDLLTAMAGLKVDLIEQPLPAGADDALADILSPVPLCADESAHVAGDVPRLARLYSHINIKLDKTGGLTGAIELADRAETAGLGLMVGCMLATSLAMAPALLLGGRAAFVDLDGPVLLARDREPGLRFTAGVIHPPGSELWG
ncbi:N-acetyl-D-Glu racemase DgcA [Rhodospirillum rubrum]|uniref:Dipeptide epimerase n=1 Tax=Rhodospirillum rubrum (strain ATCC 11170 / ATH 1.1.1 / DSM 467 / LMG 4362 / NCIMB 8255 / S1) TaxID=269796 RepID=Q2RR89_RHORT|nr:N-acetyl-D-Glu racemase DgcA [Rhodospirillum rubrum]ABC23356.1 Mandelate racemase/muconate lactonizing enzyme [Rhodospirillum rubrum ATCC 11170]AEO49089.1 mandelate racemase/muconate lactonizing protein [Rhodospirillum rubrum F11]MBK5955000.1 dipeptide epimerase [Rhodospirillum rubrum]QXG79329.1 dipeptide epimerase [Rhodospirillum rubrum]